MQPEEKKNNIVEPPQTQNTEKKDDKIKLLKIAVEKYPFKIKKKMSNKEVLIRYIINSFRNSNVTDFSAASL